MNMANTAEYLSTSKAPMKDAITLAICFLCVLSPFEGLQTLQSSLHHQQGLGVTSLAFMYIGHVIASVFTPAIIYNIGVKNSLMLAWLGHGICVLSNVYPHWATLMPGSFVLGFVSSTMWTSANICVSALAIVKVQQDSKRVPKKVTTVHAVFSHLNGVFAAILSLSFFIGNLLSSTILFQSAYKQSGASQILTCGVDYCPQSEAGQHLAPPQHHIVCIMLCVFLILSVMGMIITWWLVHDLERAQYRGQEVLRKLRSYWLPYGQVKMWLLLPVYITEGLTYSLQLGLFAEAYVGCALGIRMVGYVMAVGGLSFMTWAALIGYVARYTGRQALLTLAFLVDVATLLVLLWWRPDSGSGAMLVVLAAVMGMVNAILDVQCNALASVMFPATVDSVYSVGSTWNSLSTALTYLVARFLCPEHRIYIGLVVLSVALPCYLLAEVVHWRDLRTLDVEEDEDREEEEGTVQDTCLRAGNQAVD